MYETTQLSTRVADQSTETLQRWRDSDQARIDALAAIYASPKSPVRDAKSAAHAIGRARAVLAETVEELRNRGLSVDDVPTVDVILNKAKNPDWKEGD